MTHEAVTQSLSEYARSVRLDRRAKPSVVGDGTALELLMAPKFQALIQTLLAQGLPLAPRVLPEYRRGGIGRPDLAFARAAQPARAFIELKQPNTSLMPNRLRGHDADQFRRFSELPLWAFCSFHTIHLYLRDELCEQAVVLPPIALDPTTNDAQADRLIRRHDPTAFLAILEALALAGPIAPRDGQSLPRRSRMRHARLVRSCGISAELARRLCLPRYAQSSVKRSSRTQQRAVTIRVTRTPCSRMRSRRPWHLACCWHGRQAVGR